MPLRRRPLLRAAAVGGGAYLAGKKRGERQAQEGSGGTGSQQAQQDQGQGQGQQGGPGKAGAAQARGPAGSSTTDQLSRLTTMHKEGQLTDAEFAAAKSRLLGI
jgi:hypothetical protein